MGYRRVGGSGFSLLSIPGSVTGTSLSPVRLATTGNQTLSGLSAIDGVVPVAGNRIAVWNQTVAAENGLYVASAGAWVRTTDFDSAVADGIAAGSQVYVQEGNSNARTWLTLVTTGTITIGVTPLTFLQENLLVRTDATATQIIAAGTAFTNGTIVWSSTMDTRDFQEVSVWFQPATLGSVTSVTLYAQWSDDGSNIPFDDDNGIQQTDFLITQGTDGTFAPKDYQPILSTANGGLVANKMVMLTFPKKGGSFRFGVKGNSATGTFGAKALRISL